MALEELYLCGRRLEMLRREPLGAFSVILQTG